MADDPTPALSQNLAQNLRYVRQRRNMTQKQLAALAGVPRSTVAQLEIGGNPTLTVLARLALALRLSVEELLTAPRAQTQLFRKGSLPVQSRARGKAEVWKLLPDPVPGMEIDRIALQPGARMTGVPHRPGTREYLSCERGRLTLWTAGEHFELVPGDVCAFQGDQPHSYLNAGDAIAVGFSVVALSPELGGRPRTGD